MNTKTLWIVLAIIVVIGLGWWYMASQQTGTGIQQEQTGTEGAIPVEPDGGIGSTPTPPAGTTVVYTNDGFSPTTITVKKGATVTFLNESTGGMWVASAEHPTHTEYDGTSRTEHCTQGASTSFDQCGTSDSYSFTFTKVGTWDYHNHVSSSAKGTVIVTE